MFVFLKRQFFQIKKGGWRAFSQKISNGKNKLLLNLFAGLAVQWNLNWPQAYDFLSVKLLKDYRKLRTQRVEGESLVRAQRKAEEILRKTVARTPDLENMSSWAAANVGLAVLYFFSGEYQKHRVVFKDFERTRFYLLKSHQLDNLNVEFVPRILVSGSIGLYETLSTYVMAALLGWRPLKKMILLLPPNTKINNRCYLNYWSKYITVITDPQTIETLEPLEKALDYPFNYAMKLRDEVIVSHTAIGIVQEQWDKENRPPLLTLTQEDFNRGWQNLKLLGVPETAWFVCFHVREAGWHEKSLVEDYRNADIDTYIPAIESIVSAGGWVIRMGDPSMKPLKKMSHVIDYAHSNLKSDWMDVFLSSQCRFVVGTSSGYFMVSVAFGVPAVVTNLLPAHAIYCLSAKDLFLPGLCWHSLEKRYLNFEELVSPPVGAACEQYTYDTMGLEVIRNSAEEIKAVVEEMLDKCKGTLKYVDEDEILQERFKAAMAEVGKAYADEKVTVNSRIGRSFLRKHAALLPIGEVLSQLE